MQLQQNAAPTADAGSDQTVVEGESVQLDGTGSSDPDGDSLFYSWNQTAGPSVSLSDTASPTPSFTAPEVDSDRTLTFELKIADGNGGTDTDTVNVTVEDNQPPTADAGEEQTVKEGEQVQLDGTGSSDPDGDGLSYSWNAGNIGIGARIILSNASSPTPTFTAPEVDQNQTVSIGLAVSDGHGHTDIGTVMIHIQDVPEPNEAPNADASDDQTTVEGEVVELNASGSSDPDGDSLNYSWTQTAGTSVSLNSADIASPIFTAPEVDSDQTLSFQVEVADGNGGTDTDTVNVTVEDNQPPTADVGEDQTVKEGESVRLDGTGSSDPDGDSLSYHWDFPGVGPPEGLSNATSPTPTFTAPEVDQNQTLSFVLKVSDGHGHTDSDSGKVEVQNVPEPNQAPDADAGSDQTVDENASVTLNASNSSDPDGDSLSYAWTQTAGTSVSLSDANTATPDFTAPEVEANETLTFEVEVSDGNGGTDTDTVNVTVQNVTRPPDGPATAMSLQPSSAEIVLGNAKAFDVVIENADGGVGVYEVTISVNDSNVTAITDVALLNNPDESDIQFAENNSSVTITTALGNTADTGSVPIASVTVTGASEGSADLALNASALGTEAGQNYEVTGTTGASLSVIDLPPVDDFENPPTDPDGDGKFEDVNGDGTFNIVDVQALFANRNGSTVQNNPEKFDFNGDGKFDVVDVQALFNELITGS